jgi:hypothetical protein
MRILLHPIFALFIQSASQMPQFSQNDFCSKTRPICESVWPPSHPHNLPRVTLHCCKATAIIVPIRPHVTNKAEMCTAIRKSVLHPPQTRGRLRPRSAAKPCGLF